VTPAAAIRVLVCDDYAAMRLMLRAVIESEPGLSVVGEAADGVETIAEARRLQPDVIVLDLAMPRMSGMEALREMAVVSPASSVVVFSGFSVAAVGPELTELGAALYLQKGASPDAIVHAVVEAAAMDRAAAMHDPG